jgi:subtilisin-like proprotein convertase family protein
MPPVASVPAPLAPPRLGRGTLGLAVTALVLLVAAPAPAGAATTTFANTASIAIADSGAASPYPSTIDVTVGSGDVVLDVDVALTGLSHTFADDLDILLVGPGGQSVVLLSDAGCDAGSVDVDLTFDQSAPGLVPDSLASSTPPMASGTFQPTNYDTGGSPCGEAVDTFAPPAPAAPFGSTLDAFNGVDPAGTWSLFVSDDSAADSGSIAGGWSLTIETGVAPAITSPATASATVGTAFSHTFTATGDPGATLSYDDSDLPPGVALLGDSLSGTPTVAGTYVIVATAANGVSPDAVQTFTVTVGAAQVSTTTTTTPAAPAQPVVQEPTFTG